MCSREPGPNKQVLALLDFIHTEEGILHPDVYFVDRDPGAPRDSWRLKVDERPDVPRGGELKIEVVADRVRAFSVQMS